MDLQESWTLLIDDRRVRLTCESSLLPPFESLYTPEIKVTSRFLSRADSKLCLATRWRDG
jgi:hypothetical protein